MKKPKFYFIPAIIITIGLFVGLTASNCSNINFSNVEGNGKIITENRNVSNFNSIDASGAYNIVLNEGTENKIKIEADENLIKLIKTEVKNNILKIYNDKPITNPKKLNIIITYKNLIAIESSGACKITGNSAIKTEHFSINLSGTTDLNLKLAVVGLNTISSGAGSISISGSADTQNVELSGVSSYNASDLITNITTIDLSGAGSAEINAIKEINGELSGVGSIYYIGQPIKNISISGLGSISSIK